MNEQIFWKIIEALDWSSDYDHNRVRAELDIYFEEEFYALNEQCLRAYHDLKKAWKQWAQKYGEWVEPPPENLASAEGLKDCLYHIVALGKEDYYMHLNKPRLIYDRLDNTEYQETFSCIWH